MDESFYDSLEEDSFCECLSDLGDTDDVREESKEYSDDDNDNLSKIIPLYLKETRKTNIKTSNKEKNNTDKKKIGKDPLPIKQKKENKTYLNIFYKKIKYPAIGGGDDRTKNGSETTRAEYDPSSRIHSAVSKELSDFTHHKGYSSDESSFYEKFIAEQEIKKKSFDNHSQTETISNLLSVSEQCLSKTQLNKHKLRKTGDSKALSVPSSKVSTAVEDKNTKLQLLRKRQYYGMKASSRNKAIMEEKKFKKTMDTKYHI